jgi:hypothetical protein
MFYSCRPCVRFDRVASSLTIKEQESEAYSLRDDNMAWMEETGGDGGVFLGNEEFVFD